MIIKLSLFSTVTRPGKQKVVFKKYNIMFFKIHAIIIRKSAEASHEL